MVNKKKVIITIIIVLTIIVIFCGIFYFVSKNKIANNSTSTLTSTDQKFSIEIPNTIKYMINSTTNNDFTIDLYSEEDEMFMYATSIEKLHELDLYEIASDDKTAYFKDKENLRDDSRY